MAGKKKHNDSFDTKEVEAAVEEEVAAKAEATDNNTAPKSDSTAPVAKANKKEPKAAKTKAANKKDNFFVRIWKKLAKFLKDTKGELKKVTWTPKAEVFKSFKLVIATVVAVGLCIAVVDTVSSVVINTIAGWIG